MNNGKFNSLFQFYILNIVNYNQKHLNGGTRNNTV
jgi:hypothetical protein